MRYHFLLVLCVGALLVNAQPRNVSSLETGWKFYKGSADGAEKAGFDDSGWRDVRIPHDWGVDSAFISDGDGNTGKLPWKGEGWYRRTLEMTPADQGKIHYLVCDGIMAFPKIYINGQLAGKWDYGYNSFYIDITPYVNFDNENILAVHADTRNHDSRWYPGGGIYRKIQLVKVNPVHIDIWGTCITTPIVKPHYADIQVQTKLQSIGSTQQSKRRVSVHYAVKTQEGNFVAWDTIETQLTRSSNTLETTMTISNPRRWDIENPHLYLLITEVYLDGMLVDQTEESFGIRTIRFTSGDGFYLNDRRVQLKGVNLHHDHGPLGTAFNARAMERQLEVMQSMGCNAVRNSHNVAAPELLELCDRMGILVFNEIFDKYDGKADITDTTDFDAFTHRNIRNFVRRDRNHPSIFLWSVGNEIGDVQWNLNGGFSKLHTMINYLEKYDNTRPNTLVCDNKGSAVKRHFDYYDVHAWNYGRRYSLARQLEPDKAVVISESASTLSTRGFYELPLPEKKTDFTRSLQVSSYDLNAPWWAEVADDDFMWQQQERYVAGEFVWTGFDYIGEPTPYDNRWTTQNDMTDNEASRSSYFGIVDLCGIPKDRYYLYKSYWKPKETTVHILPHWNWEGMEGKNVPVFVYTNGDCAELFLNGRSLGMRCKQPKADSSIFRFRLIWEDVIYQPGELKAVAYREGQQIGEQVMRTAGQPALLRLTPDRTSIKADGNDLSYILIEAVDNNGNPCPLADDEIAVTIDGPGSIAGVGNGNPQSFAPFKSDKVKLFYGKALVIVKSMERTGSISVQVSSAGLKEELIMIRTK